MDLSSSTMRLAVLQFMAGFCGALGSVFLLLSVGTDYWLLASEACDGNTVRIKRFTTENGLKKDQDDTVRVVLSYHEGIFWRCSYWKGEKKDREEDSILDFWITNQPSEKVCMPAYQPQVPLSGVVTPSSSTGHRALWCIMSVLGLTMVLLGVIVTICGIPTAHRRLYEAGGALFITGGLLHFLVVGTFVAWVQGSSSLEQYVLQRRTYVCSSLHLNIHYGLSFMLAPTASFFCLLCGLLILFTQSSSRAESVRAAQDGRQEDEVFLRRTLSLALRPREMEWIGRKTL